MLEGQELTHEDGELYMKFLKQSIDEYRKELQDQGLIEEEKSEDDFIPSEENIGAVVDEDLLMAQRL